MPVENGVQVAFQLVVSQPLRGRHSERAALAAEEQVAAVRSQEGKFLFGKGVDAVLQVPRRRPFSVSVEADVEICAWIRLAPRTQFSGPVPYGGSPEPDELKIRIFSSGET